MTGCHQDLRDTISQAVGLLGVARQEFEVRMRQDLRDTYNVTYPRVLINPMDLAVLS